MIGGCLACSKKSKETGVSGDEVRQITAVKSEEGHLTDTHRGPCRNLGFDSECSGELLSGF